MSAGGWTPGPWRVGRHGPRAGMMVERDAPGTATVASCHDPSRARADARLIAAAPALYEALEAADRISILRDERSECCARINGSGRTTPAESVIVSRRRVSEIDAEIRNIRTQAKAALAAARGEARHA